MCIFLIVFEFECKSSHTCSTTEREKLYQVYTWCVPVPPLYVKILRVFLYFTVHVVHVWPHVHMFAQNEQELLFQIPATFCCCDMWWSMMGFGYVQCIWISPYPSTMFGCFVRNVTHELTSSIIMPTLNNFTAHLNFTGIKHVCKANQQGGQGTGSNGQGCSIYNLFQWMKTSIGFARCDRVPIEKILNIYFLFCTKDIIQCYGL